MSYVYFIAAKDENMVKIGFATNPWKRFAKVQSDCPLTLDIIAIEPGTKASEAALHQKFSAERLRGEWFRLSGPISDYARNQPTPIKPRCKVALGGALGAWMHRNNHTVRSAADLFGLSVGGISRTCSGQQVPRYECVVRIFQLTNGEVTPNDLYGVTKSPRPDAKQDAAA